MNISQVLISDDLIEFLEKRRLGNSYRKAKEYILSGNYRQVQLRLRQPKQLQTYYFRINRQFRALCKLEGSCLKVYDIDNHQNS